MEVTVTGIETPVTAPHKDYTSRPGALIWFFRKSRDGWKRKYQDLKVTVKADRNRRIDLTKSRDRSQQKDEQAEA